MEGGTEESNELCVCNHEQLKTVIGQTAGRRACGALEQVDLEIA